LDWGIAADYAPAPAHPARLGLRPAPEFEAWLESRPPLLPAPYRKK